VSKPLCDPKKSQLENSTFKVEHDVWELVESVGPTKKHRCRRCGVEMVSAPIDWAKEMN
jgi:hypothetical protein